jgi:hypothetical protein
MSKSALRSNESSSLPDPCDKRTSVKLGSDIAKDRRRLSEVAAGKHCGWHKLGLNNVNIKNYVQDPCQRERAG